MKKNHLEKSWGVQTCRPNVSKEQILKTEQPILITSVLAGEAIAKHLFVKADGTIAGANEKALGVANDELDNAQYGPVVILGISLVKTGGAVAQGAKIASDADGKAVTHSSGEYNGWALDAAAGADEVIRIILAH